MFPKSRDLNLKIPIFHEYEIINNFCNKICVLYIVKTIKILKISNVFDLSLHVFGLVKIIFLDTKNYMIFQAKVFSKIKI